MKVFSILSLFLIKVFAAKESAPYKIVEHRKFGSRLVKEMDKSEETKRMMNEKDTVTFIACLSGGQDSTERRVYENVAVAHPTCVLRILASCVGTGHTKKSLIRVEKDVNPITFSGDWTEIALSQFVKDKCSVMQHQNEPRKPLNKYPPVVSDFTFYVMIAIGIVMLYMQINGAFQFFERHFLEKYIDPILGIEHVTSKTESTEEQRTTKNNEKEKIA